MIFSLILIGIPVSPCGDSALSEETPLMEEHESTTTTRQAFSTSASRETSTARSAGLLSCFSTSNAFGPKTIRSLRVRQMAAGFHSFLTPCDPLLNQTGLSCQTPKPATPAGLLGVGGLGPFRPFGAQRVFLFRCPSRSSQPDE